MRKSLPRGWKAIDVVVFDDLVSVHDDWYEEREDDVDKETDECVEVDSTVDPDRPAEKHRHFTTVG